MKTLHKLSFTCWLIAFIRIATRKYGRTMMAQFNSAPNPLIPNSDL